MLYRPPATGAPSFVKGRVSVKVEDFVKFAKLHQRDGWLNIDLREAQSGKMYFALNDYKKPIADTGALEEVDLGARKNYDLKMPSKSEPKEAEEIEAGDIPF